VIYVRIKDRFKNLFYIHLTPRITLFFIAIPIKFVAIAISYLGISHRSWFLLLISVVIWLVWFILIILITLPKTDQFLKNQIRWLKRAVVIICITLLIIGLAEIAFLSAVGSGTLDNDKLDRIMPGLATMVDEIFAYTDSAALCHQAVENTIDGNNPYAQSNIVKAFTKYNVSVNNLTPLRQGRFAEAFPYPEQDELEEVWQESISTTDDIPEEFESKLNYPAGSIVLSVPFFLIGLDDMRIISFLYFLPILLYVVLQAPRHLRIILVAAILISIELWSSLVNGGAGHLVFPFMLLAWILWRKHLLFSAIFMGLAISMKQLAWFFLVFYIILILRTMGLRKLLWVTVIISGVFLAINLPFILNDPKLWITSIFAPVIDNLFPFGVGIVSFVTAEIIEIQSPLIFAIMEITILFCAIIWYFYYCPRYPYTGLILALMPLFFAWRSLPAYFLYVDIIILAAIIINEYGYKAPVKPESKPLLQMADN